MSEMWIVHEKVSVSKEFNETLYTSLCSKHMRIESLSELLELIKPKGLAIIMFEEGDTEISLTLVNPREDIKE